MIHIPSSFLRLAARKPHYSCKHKHELMLGMMNQEKESQKQGDYLFNTERKKIYYEKGDGI